jgi:hypothetical protein
VARRIPARADRLPARPPRRPGRLDRPAAGLVQTGRERPQLQRGDLALVQRAIQSPAAGRPPAHAPGAVIGDREENGPSSVVRSAVTRCESRGGSRRHKNRRAMSAFHLFADRRDLSPMGWDVPIADIPRTPSLGDRTRPISVTRLGTERAENASVRKLDCCKYRGEERGRLDRSALLTSFVSLCYAPCLTPVSCRKPRRGTALLGCLTLYL